MTKQQIFDQLSLHGWHVSDGVAVEDVGGGGKPEVNLPVLLELADEHTDLLLLGGEEIVGSTRLIRFILDTTGTP